MVAPAYTTAAATSPSQSTMQAQRSILQGQGRLHSKQRGRAVQFKSAQAETAKPVSQYQITDAQKEAFKRDGFVYLPGVMTDEEMASAVDPAYKRFLAGSVEGAPAPSGALLDVMLPRNLAPELQNNLLERRAEGIACQLLDTDEVELDFDQILAKRPNSRDSGMPWHQDAAYWPEEMAGYDCYTANIWVAVSDVPLESGCMRYVPGSHLEAALRPHKPVTNVQTEVHTLATTVKGEKARMVPMKRGDVVVHRENVVHGSGPNVTDQWRLGYVLNFKRSTCVVTERALGFTHPQKSTDKVPFTP